MISDSDRQLLTDVARLFAEGYQGPGAAKELGYKTNTLYRKLQRLGYRVNGKSELVPIHTPIPTEQVPA